MRLKKLDIVGFKSFPERTKVHLVDGVTAIVGPNGCGKTNILDALRWVMGEQRPTLLRGGKMEDVIFNGSQAMKAHGLAEVSLSVENTRGVLPTEYNELLLTRRLFRSGESEYLLNRTPCRLKDIVDLFADTGMGANAYSVIQQHMIDALISDKAEERRVLFEEAAGITKYKQRKRAALRKLEATEADLQRLHDIVSEVKSQVNSLNRQMKKAERYQKTHLQLKELELTLAKVTLEALDSERKEKRLALEEWRDKLSASETELTGLSAQLEAERQKQSESDRLLSEVATRTQAKTEEAHSVDRNITALREKTIALKAQRERNQVEIEACEKRVELLEADESQVKAELVQREESLQSTLAETTDAEQRSEAADSAALEAKAGAESDTEKLLALEGRISSGKTDTQNLSQQETELQVRLAEIAPQLTGIGDTISATCSEFERSEAIVAEKTKALAETAEQISRTNARIEELNQQLEDHTDSITDLSSSLESTQTRKLLLEETIARHEGFGAGVSAALDVNERWPRLLGALAELIAPREGYVRALEAALDDVAGYLVAEDRVTAAEVIAYLTAENKGKAAVFALEGFKQAGNAGEARRAISEPGFVGWADTLVSPDARVAPLAASLLCNTAVFDERLDSLSEKEVNALLSRLPQGCQVVSVGGSLYRGLTVLAGGSSEGMPLFGRQEMVEELALEITRLETELSAARERKNEDITEIARLRAELGKFDERIETLREENISAEKNLSELTANLRAFEADRERLQKEERDANGKLEMLRNRQYALSLDVTQLAGEKERLMASVNERASQLSGLEGAAQGAADSLNRLQVRLVEERSSVNQLTDKVRHLQELKAEVIQARESNIRENEEALVEIESSNRQIAELEVALKALFEERDEMLSREGAIRAERQEVLGELQRREDAMRSLRGSKDESLEQSHKLDLRLSQIESDMTALLDRSYEEYSIDPRSYVPEVKAEGDKTETPGLESEEERRAAKNSIVELKNRLKSYGAVNLLAIEEYQGATERHEHLAAQLEDLLSAKQTLTSTISKINKTARELFSETFQVARQNFKSIFTELFDGGECDIRLRDENDPLESDIEIIAKPKGKKLVTITQMSGGERALTAISLLFSLYLVKPSPFCILDEIDAPLDDANCHRFLRLIRRFSNQTQFIVITHNKITMEAADTLYGVTMESPGVSKLVSVRFADGETAGKTLLDMDSAIVDDDDDLEEAAGLRPKRRRKVKAEDATVETTEQKSGTVVELDTMPETEPEPGSEFDEEIAAGSPEAENSTVRTEAEIPQTVIERITPQFSGAGAPAPETPEPVEE